MGEEGDVELHILAVTLSVKENSLSPDRFQVRVYGMIILTAIATDFLDKFYTKIALIF